MSKEIQEAKEAVWAAERRLAASERALSTLKCMAGTENELSYTCTGSSGTRYTVYFTGTTSVLVHRLEDHHWASIGFYHPWGWVPFWFSRFLVWQAIARSEVQINWDLRRRIQIAQHVYTKANSQ